MRVIIFITMTSRDIKLDEGERKLNKKRMITQVLPVLITVFSYLITSHLIITGYHIYYLKRDAHDRMDRIKRELFDTFFMMSYSIIIIISCCCV